MDIVESEIHNGRSSGVISAFDDESANTTIAGDSHLLEVKDQMEECRFSNVPEEGMVLVLASRQTSIWTSSLSPAPT